MVLARLFHLTGDANWRTRAEKVLRGFAGQADQLASMPTLLAAADLLEEGASAVIAGTASPNFVEAALRSPDPAVTSPAATPVSRNVDAGQRVNFTAMASRVSTVML